MRGLSASANLFVGRTSDASGRIAKLENSEIEGFKGNIFIIHDEVAANVEILRVCALALVWVCDSSLRDTVCELADSKI